jgi:hypothetical protein
MTGRKFRAEQAWNVPFSIQSNDADHKTALSAKIVNERLP